MNHSTTRLPEPTYILAFSAESPARLEEVTTRLRNYLREHPEVPISEIAYGLSALPREEPLRRFALCADRDDAIDALSRPERMLTGARHATAPTVAFLFPGLGEQYVGMAAELYQTQPVFRDCIDTCSRLAKGILDRDLRELLELSRTGRGNPGELDLVRMLRRGTSNEAPDVVLQQTCFAQPAIFAIEYALGQLWISWGVRPGAMLGYSIGEYVAACTAGVMSLPQALQIVTQRARLIQRLPEGGMLAVPQSEGDAERLLSGTLSIAAVNGEALCVLAGTNSEIAAVQDQLSGNQEAAIRLQTTHAFHSKMMEPIVRDFEAVVERFSLKQPRIPYISNLTGTWVWDHEAVDPKYWAAHLCMPVRFYDGLRVLWQDPRRVFLEVGPGRSLTTLALHNAPPGIAQPLAVHSLRPAYETTRDNAVLLDAVGRLWLAGVPIDWDRVVASGVARNETALAELRSQLLPQAAPTPALEGRLDQERPSASAAGPVPVVPGDGGRKAWRQRPRLFSAYVAPSSEPEKMLAALWQDALRLEQVGIHDNFFELGGHSLLALAILDRVDSARAVRLPLRQFFERPTIAELAEVVSHSIEKKTTTADQPPCSTPNRRIAAVSHQSVYTLPNGLEITHQNKAETDHFYEDIFEHNTYVRHLGGLPENACVFDVGANIGLFSLFVHTLGKGAKIYAFEPSPPTFEVLRRNVTKHGVNAKIFEMGLSDAEKTAEFTFYPHSSGMSSVYGDEGEEKAVLRGILQNQAQENADKMGLIMAHSEELLEQRLKSQRFSCRFRTLSSVMREEGIEHIDLLKIDVQKSELDVLTGIEPNDWAKIRSMAVEVHDVDGRVERTRRLLQGRAYDVKVHQDELYRGTGIHLLYATRRDHAVDLPLHT